MGVRGGADQAAGAARFRSAQAQFGHAQSVQVQLPPLAQAQSGLAVAHRQAGAQVQGWQVHWSVMGRLLVFRLW